MAGQDIIGMTHDIDDPNFRGNSLDGLIGKKVPHDQQSGCPCGKEAEGFHG